ncbi:MAG: PorP/SprF family type IX secretion system membrane protein [Cyclobacteriaceae bacterium]|nr:PorP/SprF family type IX secretion system membrane protein [Cyclobacteriaceae bacterium]
MQKRKYYIIVILFFLGIFRINAQDPVFSQFYNSAVYLNPALIGEEKNMYLNFAHRSQWGNLDFPYSTSQVSLIIPYFSDKHVKPEGHVGGVGVSFYGDEAGQGSNLRTYGGNASFAYNLHLSTKSENRITFGMQLGFIHKNIDRHKLEWGEQYNPFIGFDNTIVPVDLDQIQNRTFFDVTSGIFWRYFANSDLKKVRSIYAGFSAGHLNHPDESVIEGNSNRLPVLYKLHGGMVFALNEKASISANFLSMLQDQVNQTNVGSFLSYKLPFDTRGQMSNFVTRVGAWYRVQDSFIASIEFLSNNLQFGFSYDWNVTSLRYNNRGAGSFEISMGYRFFKPAAPKIRY